MTDDDRSAWLEAMMTRWETRLIRLCYAYLHDAALAEDAVQETFLKAWKGYGRFRGEAAETTWIMRIAINTCKDLRRSAWFRHVDRAAEAQALPQSAQPFSQADDAITRAVMKLKPSLREVALLRWYQGLTASETAEALGIARTTVYDRLERAQRKLQRELEAWRHEVD